MTMKTTIGTYDPDSKSVPVTFTDGAVKHSRSVNAVLKDDGSYDREATKARVQEVANGVAAKIAIGLLRAD